MRAAASSSMSSSSSIDTSGLPSAQTSPKKKASPSDVIFGAPPGADDLSRKYDALNSHSTLQPLSDISQVADTNVESSKLRDTLVSSQKLGNGGDPTGPSRPYPTTTGTTSDTVGRAQTSSWNEKRPQTMLQSSEASASSSDSRPSQAENGNASASASGSSGSGSGSVSGAGGSSGSVSGTGATTATVGTAASMAEDAASGRTQALSSTSAFEFTEEDGAQIKIVPALLEDADPEDIVALVADMLARLIAHNDLIPLHPSSLTRFHSRATPAISISSYLRRIARYTSLDKACALILLVYIDRVCARMDGFTICGLTVHRFVCAAVVCASKALCDAFSTNGHYARVGGISLIELNMLEKEFLTIIDWRLTCSGALLQHYYTSLVRSHSGFRLTGDTKSDASDSIPSSSMDVDMTFGN